MSTQKLSSMVKNGSNRNFNPQGFIDGKGVYVPLVKPNQAKHAVSIKTIGMIEDQLYDLGVDPAIIARVEIVAAGHEALALESTIREEHEAEKAKAEAGNGKAEAEAEKAKVVRKGALSSFGK